MPFKYNPPTRSFCEICEKAINDKVTPIIDTHSGKASSANNFPFHNWYNFVLGYTPDFPEYLLKKFGATKKSIVLDPFMGTGTTNVVCKSWGIKSFGLEANDYFIDVAKSKLTWDIKLSDVEKYSELILNDILDEVGKIDFKQDEIDPQLKFSDFSKNNTETIDYKLLSKDRPKELPERYICDRPMVKLFLINKVIQKILRNESVELIRFFNLAWTSIIVPSSNISYGPGFGVRKAKKDVDVFSLFKEKLIRMIDDLKSVQENTVIDTEFQIIHGDSRRMNEHFQEESVDMMITSPPYPGDHEYTKHTKLELVFTDHAKTLQEFRVIKKRMLVGSTTNIYKENNDRVNVEGNPLIKDVTDLIQLRLDEDNATSGFEKLYTKLVWEYFGGMALVFRTALKILKSGGKFALLVSDSHAFKMVHIQTAVILRDIALKEGFSEGEIELWQFKKSTSHNYKLREDILILTK